MALNWFHEDTPRWDAGKAAIVGGVPPGSLEVPTLEEGDLVPGEWFRVEEDRKTVGYGWMDCTWGDAEILLAIAAGRQRSGIGAFVLDRLEEEAASRGVNYMVNAVRAGHPRKAAVTRWLENHGFTPSGDGLLKRRVRRS
jgi:GNAT superfamily N-acetyltransferase